MKKTKFTKLFVLILSLALLIGSAIGIAASADETDTAYAIKSMNIAHGDRTQVLIAVDAVGVDAAEIEVTYTLAGETYVASFYDYVDIYNNDTEYPVFYTKGIPAKDCGQDVLAEAHVAGTTPASPKYMNVSVAGYLYDRLYKAGYISATEGESLEKKNLYLAFVEYISAAEEVLWNYNNPTDQRTLLKDKTYVYAEGGYIPKVGANAGFITGALTVDYIGLEPNQSGWYVESASGLDLVFGNSITLTESARIYPYFNNYVMDFEDATLGAGLFSEWVGEKDIKDKNGNPAYSKSTTTVADLDKMGGITPSYTPNEDITAGRIATGGTHVLIKEDTAGNKYLSFKAVARTNYTVVPDVSKGDRSNPPGFTIPVTDVDANANVTIWSYDAIFDSSCSGPAQIMFVTSGKANIIYPYIRGNNGQSISILGSSGSPTVANFATGKYVNIRFEYYWGEGVCQIYLNGVYQGSFTNTYSTQPHAKPGSISFGMDGSSAMGAIFDNMTAVNIYKPYNANPTVAPFYETFSGTYQSGRVEWFCNEATFLGEFAAADEEAGTPAGKLYGLTDANGVAYGADYKFHADTLAFASGISANFAVTQAEVDEAGGTSGYSNVHGSKAEIVTDANGNEYLSLVSPTRVSGRDRAHGLRAYPVMLDASHTTYVFDYDLRVNYGDIQYYVYSSAGYSQYGTGAKNGAVNFGHVAGNGGAIIGEYGEWVTMRAVIYSGAEGGPAIEFYVKDAKGNYQLLEDVRNNGGDVAKLTNITSISFAPGTNAAIDVDNVALYTVGEGFDPTK